MTSPAIDRAADALIIALKDTEAFQTYAALKESVMADDGYRALLRRYSAAQTALQMAALSGAEARQEDTDAFEQLSSLLYASPVCTDYLLAQMRVQQMVANLIQRVTGAMELDMAIPEL